MSSIVELNALIAIGEGIEQRAARLSDAAERERGNMGAPSDWIKNEEHFDWFREATHWVDTYFGGDSEEAARWREVSNQGQAEHDRSAWTTGNFYVAYLALYRRSLQCLRQFAARAHQRQEAMAREEEGRRQEEQDRARRGEGTARAAGAPQEELSPVERFLRGVEKSWHYLLKRFGRLGALLAALVILTALLIANAKTIAEGIGVLANAVGFGG